MGVAVELRSPVTDLAAELGDGGWDAAFLAVGAQLGKRTEISAGDSELRIDATDVYRRTRDRLPAHLMERDQAQAEVASTQLLQGMRTGRRRMPG